MKKITIILPLVVLLTLNIYTVGGEGQVNKGFSESFSIITEEGSKSTLNKTLPTGWEKLKFPKIKKETSYKVVKEGSNFVLRAESKDSASGIVKKININLKEFPILSWKWKVENVFSGGDASLKSGDDYPARIYITFEYDPSKVPFWERVLYKLIKLIYGEVPSSAINYIWANKLEKGTFVPNAYTDKVIMFAVESGVGVQGKWVSETRNVYEDYKLAFGKEPPTVTSIAVMTDSDNTGESVIAYYDDISFTSTEVKK